MSDLWGKFQIILAQYVVVSNCFGPFFGHFRVRSEISGMSPGDACHLFVNGDGCKVVYMCTWPIPRFRSRTLRTLHYVFRAFVIHQFVLSTYFPEKEIYTLDH